MDWLIYYLREISQGFSELFSVSYFMDAISNPANWGIIGALIILEGLLSADNALVLAIMVKHLPGKQKRKALFYGILGAIGFRLLAIGFGAYLIKIWWIKILGSIYLSWLVIRYFFFKEKDDNKISGENSYSFWRTVLAVEMVDIAFSIDSILAALGISDKLWVLCLGGFLGILMMRGVAQIFLVLIEKMPELETTAYILIAFISIKMISSIVGFNINDMFFFLSLLVLFVVTFVYHRIASGSVEKNNI